MTRISQTTYAKSPSSNLFDDPALNPYSPPKTISYIQRPMKVQELRSSIPWFYNPFANQMRFTRELASALCQAHNLAGHSTVQAEHLLIAIAESANEPVWNIIRRATKCQTIEELKKRFNVGNTAGIITAQIPDIGSWYLKVTDIKQPIELSSELVTALREVEADMDLLDRRHKIVSTTDILFKIFQMHPSISKQTSVYMLINKRCFNNLRLRTPVTKAYRATLLENYLT